MKNQTRILSLLILACLIFLISCTKETIIEPDNVISTWYELHKNPNTLETVQWDKMTTLQLSDSSIAYSVPAKDSVNFKELVFFKEVGKQEAVYKVYSPLKNGLELKVYSLSGILLKNGIINRRSSKKYSSSFREMRKDIEIGTLLDEVIVTAPKLSGSDWSAWTGVHYGGGGDYSQGYLPYFGSGGGGGGNSSPMNFSDYNYSKITNNLTNPCFIEVLQELQAGNAYGRVGEILRKFGLENSGLNFTINEKEIPISYSKTKVNGLEYDIVNRIFGNTVDNTISLNPVTLNQASKEFIAATILHEMLHVYINIDGLTEHNQIIENYTNGISEMLISIYHMSPVEAKNISYSGLRSTGFYTKNILSNSILHNSINLSISNYANYLNNMNHGTYCKN